MNLTYSRKYNLHLNGNEMSGDTFGCKSFIKDHLSGKWNPERKVWVVDVSLVQKWIDKSVLHVIEGHVTHDAPAKHGDSGWCPICHDWTYGDCVANGAHR